MPAPFLLLINSVRQHQLLNHFFVCATNSICKLKVQVFSSVCHLIGFPRIMSKCESETLECFHPLGMSVVQLGPAPSYCHADPSRVMVKPWSGSCKTCIGAFVPMFAHYSWSRRSGVAWTCKSCHCQMLSVLAKLFSLRRAGDCSRSFATSCSRV